MSVRDLFHQNHVSMPMEFKEWANVHRVRSELDLDLDLGDFMSNFDGFNSISYQCLHQEEIECEEQVLKTRWQLLKSCPRKMHFH